MPQLGLAVLGGLVLGFSFPPFHFGWLAYAGFVPIILSIEIADSYKEVFKLSYFAFLAFNVVVIYWVGGWSKESDPFMMIGGTALLLGHPIFFTVPVLIYFFLKKHLGPVALAAFPLVYLSFEHLHSITEIAFPWLTIAYSQSYNLADIQFAEYTGVLGVSLQILIVNSLLAYCVMLYGRRNNSRVNLLLPALTVVLLISLPQIYGAIVLKNSRDSSHSLKVAIVQPNIDPYAKWIGDPEEILHTYENETTRILPANPELVVWPETAIPFYILLPQFHYFKSDLDAFVGRNGIALLSGVPLAHYFSTKDSAKPSSHFDEMNHKYYDAYNGAALFLPDSAPAQTYGKIVLVPFGERLPYADDLPFLIKPLEWGVGVSNWARGTDTTVFKLGDGTKFSTVICYESVFADYVRLFVKRGAQFLVVITNDGWFGKSSGPRQHAAYAAFRAVENRRAIVRSANTGISEVLDPYGRFIGKPTGLDVPASVVANIPLRSDMTFYTMHGDLVALISELLSLASILFALFLKFKYRTKENEYELHRSTK